MKSDREQTEMTASRSSSTLNGRSALVALALVVPAPTIGTIASMHLDLGIVGEIIYGLSKLWILIVPLVWFRFIEKQKWSLSPARLGGFPTGIFLGLVIAIGIVACYILFGGALIDPELMRSFAQEKELDVVWRYLGLSIYLIAVNSLLEELVWRWFVFRKCEQLMPGWLAVLASALLFTIHHIFALRAHMGWTPALLSSMGVFIGGAVWSWCYLRFRSVWPGYVSHAIVDLAILGIGWSIIFGFGGSA
jgi:membrane protease YdiL (CAAX protease family)